VRNSDLYNHLRTSLSFYLILRSSFGLTAHIHQQNSKSCMQLLCGTFFVTPSAITHQARVKFHGRYGVLMWINW